MRTRKATASAAPKVLRSILLNPKGLSRRHHSWWIEVPCLNLPRSSKLNNDVSSYTEEKLTGALYQKERGAKSQKPGSSPYPDTFALVEAEQTTYSL